MTTENLKNFFEEKDFNVHLTEQDNVQCAELETWTNGGVDMIMWLNHFTVDEFKQRVKDNNADEEIDLYRQVQDYKNAFSIRVSLKDFDDYHSRLKDVLSQLPVS